MKAEIFQVFRKTTLYFSYNLLFRAKILLFFGELDFFVSLHILKQKIFFI